MSPALEVQSPNCWTPREVPRGQVLFVFVSALPKSSHRVLLSGVPSSASWLHLATKAFPDCPPAFFLFLGICFFFPPGQLKSLSLYLEFMVFPRYVQMWIFPLLLYGCWVSGRLCGPVLGDRGRHPLHRPVPVLPAGPSSAGPGLEASCRLCSLDHLLPAFQSACPLG